MSASTNVQGSVVLPEGPWEVYGIANKPMPFDVTTSANLKDLIVHNLPGNAPVTTLSQAVTAWMAANVNTEVTEPLVEGILSDPDSAARTVLDSTYAPVWKATTAYAAGVPVLLPNGKTGTRTTAGTSRASFDTTEEAAWTIAAGGLDAGAVESVVNEIGVETGATGEALTHLDAQGRTSWLGVRLDGTMPTRTKTAVGQAVLESGAITEAIADVGVETTVTNGLESFTHVDGQGRKSYLGVMGDGTPPQRTADAIKARMDLSQMQARNLIHEWWIKDAYTWVGGRLVWTLYGSTDGTIHAGEWRPGMGVTADVIVGDTVAFAIDDHCAPGHWMADDTRCGVMVWQHHAGDNLLRVAVAAPGDVASFQDSPVTTIDVGDTVSYGSPIPITSGSTDTDMLFWVPVRSPGSNWRFARFSVNQATRAVTPLSTLFFAKSSGGQFYGSFADARVASGNQKIRAAMYHNPAQPDNHVWYLEIDVVTGAVTNPFGTITLNVLTATEDLELNGNQTSPAVTPALAHDSAVDRRLFYVSDGPYKPRIAYAEWPTGQPDNATYRVFDVQAGTSTAVVAAGPRFGYTAEANYLCGMAFDSPATDDTVYVARNLNPGGRLERYWTGRSGTTRSKVLATSKYPIIRPLTARGRGPLVMWFDLESYDYFLAAGWLRSSNNR
ncbi:hypothetical protein [Gordonia alkanivorans]|uniref:hypothetical protein n=1 Tax=Gordonia alkanivorans TaxID=84096 RepID=UPI0012F49657|nr:hypothetical protein [Gordonia alkanivorans]